MSGIPILSLLWVVVGFSLTYGQPSNLILGSYHNFFLNEVSNSECMPFLSKHVPGGHNPLHLNPASPDPPNPNTMNSEGTFAFFEMMFAVITPLIMTGAFAERTPP